MQHESDGYIFPRDAQPELRKRDYLQNAVAAVWNLGAAEHALVDAQHRGYGGR